MVLRTQSKKLNLVKEQLSNSQVSVTSFTAICFQVFKAGFFFFFKLSVFDPLLLQPQLNFISRIAKFGDSLEVISPAETQM